METVLEFARGPLFIMTFLFMVLGLARQVYLQVTNILKAVQRLSYRNFSLWKALKSLSEWMLPVRHIYKNRPLMSITSFVFHVGLLLVPVLLVHHIDLWKRGVGVSWPGIPLNVADVLTLITIAAVILLLFYRIFDPGARAMSTPIDYFLLILLIVPFVSGFMACHPAFNPVSYQLAMLVHVLSAEMVFVLMPFTKLVHCVVFVFDRLSSNIFWILPVGAGEKVARELHGEEAKV